MKIALTGATGFVGSHILAELVSHDHEVTALVRDDTEATSVTANGATSAIVDLNDRPAVVKLFDDADGAVHTASPGDETSAKLDSAVVDAAVEAFGASEKPYAHISGLWVFGATPRSPKNRLTTPRQWWPGRRQSISASWASRVCAAS